MISGQPLFPEYRRARTVIQTNVPLPQEVSIERSG
jgi:hypothetical protein